MRGVFRSFDLSVDEKMRRSNRLFFKVEMISLYGGDNSPLNRRFFSMVEIANRKSTVFSVKKTVLHLGSDSTGRSDTGISLAFVVKKSFWKGFVVKSRISEICRQSHWRNPCFCRQESLFEGFCRQDSNIRDLPTKPWG